MSHALLRLTSGAGLAALVLTVASSSVIAQPAPAPAPAPAPIEPAPAPEAGPVVEPAPLPVEAAPIAVEPTVATEPAPAEKQSPVVGVTYDKGLTFASDDEKFQLRIAFRNQLRFELNRPLDDGAEWDSKFSAPRIRLQFEGHVFGKDNRYKLELAAGDRGSFSFVRDVFVEKKLADKLWLRLGQWKRPFNRQELVSDFSSEFNERAITAEFVGGGRDMGLAIHNDYEKSPEGLEWVVGVFNRFSGGSDRPTSTPTCSTDDDGDIGCTLPAFSTVPGDMSPAAVARVGWNHGGIKGYSEGDLEGGPLRFAVGLAYKIDFAQLKAGSEESVSDNLSHGVQADAIVKVEGFDLLAGVYMMKLKSADAELGYLAQAGYFIAPKKVQVAGRFALVSEPEDVSLIEARAGFNYYFQGHAWKIVTDAGFLQRTGGDSDDDPDLQLRTMAQLTL
jgi:phosphate-selective porin OprO and OprP